MLSDWAKRAREDEFRPKRVKSGGRPPALTADESEILIGHVIKLLIDKKRVSTQTVEEAAQKFFGLDLKQQFISRWFSKHGFTNKKTQGQHRPGFERMIFMIFGACVVISHALLAFGSQHHRRCSAVP